MQGEKKDARASEKIKDHCTFFPDGIWKIRWGNFACKAHDEAYRDQKNKLWADTKLFFTLIGVALNALVVFVFLSFTAIIVYVTVLTIGTLWYWRAGKNKDLKHGRDKED